MSKTVSGLIAHCKEALANNVQYVYGAKMQVLTYAQIKALQDTYGKSYVWDSDLNKAGKLCCDCSGLISSYTGTTRGSSQYKSTATQTATIAQLKANWSNYVGWGLWLQGHIGVVSDTEGYYYAMDGSASNMVHRKLSYQSWSAVIKICDIDYSSTITTTESATTTVTEEDDEMVETGTITINDKDIKIDMINKDGVTFVKLRGLENAGFKVGYDEGSKNRTLDNEISNIPVIVDGSSKTVESVNIAGYNYCKLRDVADAVGNMEVGYTNGNVTITTK